MKTNDILISISLLERTLAFMGENTREPIRKSTLEQISRLVDMAVDKFAAYGRDVLILVPLTEVTQLIEVIVSDETFAETDNETKKLLISKVKEALANLYLFAGKFYTANEFEYSMGLGDLIKRIVDNCISSNYYFGYDVLLRQEGAIS